MSTDMPPIDLEQIRRRQLAAKDALAKMTLGWDEGAPTKVDVEATLRDTLMLVASIERVHITHQPVRIYETCETDGCERDDCTESSDGGVFIHTTEYVRTECSSCIDAYEEHAEYPCATIKALEPVVWRGHLAPGS